MGRQKRNAVCRLQFSGSSWLIQIPDSEISYFLIFQSSTLLKCFVCLRGVWLVYIVGCLTWDSLIVVDVPEEYVCLL